MKIKFIFKWFDFWVGLFYDTKKKDLYIFPIPMFGFLISFKSNTIKNVNNSSINIKSNNTHIENINNSKINIE